MDGKGLFIDERSNPSLIPWDSGGSMWINGASLVQVMQSVWPSQRVLASARGHGAEGTEVVLLVFTFQEQFTEVFFFHSSANHELSHLAGCSSGVLSSPVI